MALKVRASAASLLLPTQPRIDRRPWNNCPGTTCIGSLGAATMINWLSYLMHATSS